MIDRFQYSPWGFWAEADERAMAVQRELQRELVADHPGYVIGDGCFVSDLASIDNDELRLGDRTYVAAGAYLTGSLRTGSDCSMNPYTVIRGDVTLGNAVRIGAHTSILGFNHTMEPGTEVFRQPLSSKGIRIGDDVWIGSHAVILDGVQVGDHSVIAAGAVVTRAVPAGAIVAGNPARFLRWRVPPAETAESAIAGRHDDLADRVARFGTMARAQANEVLARSWNADLGLFVDRPGAPPTVRAQCDAVEIADLLLGEPPPQLSRDRQVQRLQGWQDASTGRVARLDPDGGLQSGIAADDPDAAYHVLCVGYALDLLGSEASAPLRLVTGSSAAEITAFCDGLPWETQAWTAGHWVDGLGTALHWSRRRGDPLPAGITEALFGWLVTHADPATGMWGRPSPGDGQLQLVNGFYRASRGTFAQFGVPIPYPDRVIDTVLDHVRDERIFARERQNACNVLDAAHPLWLTRATRHRSDEVVTVARRLLGEALDGWSEGRGFGFGAPRGATAAGPDAATDAEPGLQGTEMWLAIIWYLSDLAGLSGSLGYRPRGVHRPEPAPLG